MQRHVLVDNKVRTDKTYPAGFMGMHHFEFFSLFFFGVRLMSLFCGSAMTVNANLL